MGNVINGSVNKNSKEKSRCQMGVQIVKIIITIVSICKLLIIKLDSQ